MTVHPVAELFPLLSDEEMQALADDIREHGLLQPLVQDYAGQLIDGRNRLRACELAGVEPRFVTYEGDDPASYALSVNLRRRDMSRGAKSMVSAKARRLLGKQTMREAARLVGVSPSDLAYAETVLDWAPELANAVVRGASLNEAYQFARERKQVAEDAESYEAKREKRIEKQRKENEQRLERQRAKVRDSIALIGPAVPLAPLPEVTQTKMEWPATVGSALDIGLDEQKALLDALIDVETRLKKLRPAPENPMTPLYTAAVHSAITHLVAAAVTLDEQHQDILTKHTTLREVQPVSVPIPVPHLRSVSDP